MAAKTLAQLVMEGKTATELIGGELLLVEQYNEGLDEFESRSCEANVLRAFITQSLRTQIVVKNDSLSYTIAESDFSDTGKRVIYFTLSDSISVTVDISLLGAIAQGQACQVYMAGNGTLTISGDIEGDGVLSQNQSCRLVKYAGVLLVLR